jgi:hypothetical protein
MHPTSENFRGMIPRALAIILHEKHSTLTVKNMFSTGRHYFIPTGERTWD